MPTAQSNVEKYLAVIAGHDTEVPTQPASRVEWYLNEILQNGGGGGGESSLKVRVVSTLPAAGVSGILYLVPTGQGSGVNIYDEYVWVEDETKFELLGQTGINIDLSGYVPNTRKVGGKTLERDVGITISGAAPIHISDNGTATTVAYEISHEDSGVTAGAKGETSNQTPNFGETFKVTSETVNATGHVTNLSEHTVKIPDAKASASRDGLMSKEDKTKLDKFVPKGSATKGVYIDSENDAREMTYEVKAEVPENFAAGIETPLMDGTASTGASMKYAREDHIHPVDKSRASASDVETLKKENDLLKELINGVDAPIYRTASGNPATFADGYDNATLKNLTVAITPAQSGSGDPSPDNVRPIIGCNTLTITRTDADGAESANAQTVTVALTDGTDPLTVYGGSLNLTTGVLTITRQNVTLTGSETWVAYEMGNASQRYALFTAQNNLPNLDVADRLNVISSHFKNSNVFNNVSFDFIYVSVANSVVAICDGASPHRFSSLNDFKSWLADQYAAGTPVQILYPLVTPITYQLSPVSLTSLLGYNSVSADAGTLSVTYRADISLAYAELESNLTNAILSLGAGF